MNQDATLQDICAQQIQRWLDDGWLLSSITAAELHQATDLPYTQCLEALRNFTQATDETTTPSALVPPPPAALQDIFRQSQQLIWQSFYQDKQEALDQLQQAFSHEKTQLQQMADERLAMIVKLEQKLAAKDTASPDHKEEKSHVKLLEAEQRLEEEARFIKSQEEEVIRLRKQLADTEQSRAELEQQLSREKEDNVLSHDQTAEQARAISQLNQQITDYEQELSLLKSQLNAAEQKASRHQDELQKEQQSLNQALTLSDEQAKEISELSRKLDAAEQEYLRVMGLYQDAKKQGTQLQKELKKIKGR